MAVPEVCAAWALAARYPAGSDVVMSTPLSGTPCWDSTGQSPSQFLEIGMSLPWHQALNRTPQLMSKPTPPGRWLRQHPRTPCQLPQRLRWGTRIQNANLPWPRFADNAWQRCGVHELLGATIIGMAPAAASRPTGVDLHGASTDTHGSVPSSTRWSRHAWSILPGRR